MTFSGHAAVASLTLLFSREAAILIPLNIALHYVTDAIPHAEFFFAKKWGAKLFWILLDTSVTLGLIWIAFSRLHLSPELVGMVFGASFLPDIIDPLTRKVARPIRWFHLLMHTWPRTPVAHQDWNKTMTGRTAIWLKLAMQATLIVVSLALLI